MFGFQVHGQVLINTWLVIFMIVTVSILTTKELKLIPSFGQIFIEFVTEFIRDIAKSQIGEKEYLKWVPYLGTIFLFIFVSNWSGALIPWKLIELPNGELGAPTNDMCAMKLLEYINQLVILTCYLSNLKNFSITKNTL